MVFIDFAAADDPYYYAFRKTGNSRVVLGNGTAQPPADVWIPTGDVIGHYRTLAEARAAHPTAHVNKNAFQAYDVRGK